MTSPFRLFSPNYLAAYLELPQPPSASLAVTANSRLLVMPSPLPPASSSPPHLVPGDPPLAAAAPRPSVISGGHPLCCGEVGGLR